MICNRAEPQTTNMNNANSHGPTGYFSSDAYFLNHDLKSIEFKKNQKINHLILTADLGTLPRSTTFFDAFSLAKRIRCDFTIFFNNEKKILQMKTKDKNLPRV